MKKTFIAVLLGCLMFCSPVFAFSDVSEDFWAYEKIEQMYKSGVISGFEDGTFKPNDTLTREQAAAVMANFFTLSLAEDAVKFEDITSGYWSEEYVNLVGQFIPVDANDGKYYFRPFDNATRIEIAEAIIKIIGYDELETDYNIIESFNDKDSFSENDKKYIALAANNKIMVGDDNSNFRPNDTITRAEFCALIYNIYLIKSDLQAVDTEKNVMTINGEKVSLQEFELYFNLQKKAYESMFGSENIWEEQIDGVYLEDMVKDATKYGIIDIKVKIQKANELGVKISDEELEHLESYTKSDVGSEICEFYNITPEQLFKINSEGILMEELGKVIYNTLDHSNHSHVDINKPIDTLVYDARHILLSTVDLTEEEKAKVKEDAQNILNRVKNGEDFASLAEEFSVDGGSNQNGGLYEDIALGEFVTEFEQAALSLSDGTIYPELVESSYGYHIIKLEAKKQTQRELTADEKQSIIDADLEEAAAKWIEDAIVEENEEVYEAI